MGTIVDQDVLDAIFRDLDSCLMARTEDAPRHLRCCHCNNTLLSYNTAESSHPGSLTCDSCGVQQPGLVFYENMYGNYFTTRSSNYKRIHHWHERISQLLLLESQIPFEQMWAIAKELCSGKYTSIDKTCIRAVLRSLGLQQYIEKWLQIIYRITNIAPPKPGRVLLNKLDEYFIELQQPFDCYRAEKRKNFLNYNYVFCRLLQKMDCTQFCMFFPLIKSPYKLKQLDTVWNQMAESLQWPVTSLVQVAPFAVQLRQPSLLLDRLASQYVPSIPAALQTETLQMVFRTLDRRSLGKMIHKIERRRSSRSAPSPRKFAAELTTQHCVEVESPQSRPQ